MALTTVRVWLDLLYKVQKMDLDNTLPASDFDPQGISKFCNLKTLCDYEIINKLVDQKKLLCLLEYKF